METPQIELTSKQKKRLLSLSQETGKPITILLDEALDGLQTYLYPKARHGAENGGNESVFAPNESHKPIWKLFAEAFKDVPDEELERLPTDGATQHDHYIYGTPKRPS